MANEKPAAEEVAKEKVVAPEGDEASFTVERLLEEPQALGAGTTAADVAGAFAGVAPSKAVTVKSAKDRVARFLKGAESKDNVESQE